MISAAPSPAEPRRKRRLWRWLLGIAAVLVVVPIVTLYALTWYAEHRFQAELDKIRARGEPVDPRGVEAARVYPDLDLTDVYVGASTGLGVHAGLVENENDWDVIPLFGNSYEPPLPGEPWQDRDVSERVLNRARGQLLMLHDAVARKGDAFFRVNLGDETGAYVMHASELRQAAKFVLLEAYCSAHRGEPSAAANSIHVVLRMSWTLRQDPVVTSFLVRASIDDLARTAIRRLLPVVDWTTLELTTFQHDLRVCNYAEGIRLMLFGERVLIIEAFQRPELFFSAKPSLFRDWLVRLGVKNGAAADENQGRPMLWAYHNIDDFCRFCDLTAGLIALADKPWPVARAEATRLEQPFADMLAPQELQIHVYELKDLHVPGFDLVFTRVARDTAHNRAADASIGAELYRRKHGKLPEKIEQLVPEFLPEVPIDPFDGKPLRYLVREDKYVFYSIGPDGEDNGAPGPLPEDPNGDGPDVEFAVKRVKK